MELRIIFQLVAERVSAIDPALLPAEIGFRAFLPQTEPQPGLQPELPPRTEPAGLAFASRREATRSATERTTGSLEPVIHKEPQSSE